MIWDTTPQALREWRKRRCAEYEDAANTSLENPMPALFWGVLSDALEEAVSKTATPESEAPSMCFHVGVKTRKKASGTGPYPKLVEALRGVLRERDENPIGLRAMLKWRVALTLCKLLCFVRVHGVKGLERLNTINSGGICWRNWRALRNAARFSARSLGNRRKGGGIGES